MSGSSETSEADQQQTGTGENDETQTLTVAAAAAPPPTTPLSTPTPQPHPFMRPPPSQSFDPAAVFMEAYDCAKLNNNWNKVSSSLMIHPEWLVKIPEGRRWTMLHQIVFSGDVMHLNEVLALQANNPDFRLLCKTLDDKTVREVAAERAHVHPQMLRRIERLVAVDQLLNNAKDRKWDLVKQCITLQPDIVNEKPPYRRFYLAHHLALVGELNMFKELSKKCHFKLDLLAENKTISQIAREHNHTAFAEYIDSLATTSNETTEEDTDDTTTPPYPTGEHHFSPGFYEDPGISFIPANLDLNNLFTTTTGASSFINHHPHQHQQQHQQNQQHHHPHTNPDSHFATHSLYQGHHHPHTNHDTHFATHSLYQGHNPVILSTMMPVASAEQSSIQEEQETDNSKHSKSVQPKPNTSELTDEEQLAYEKTIIGNVQKMSQQNLLNSITCCITKTILHDPVVAADGFTYERQAILNWFEHSNRSPMTNQELESLELKPNYAIKSILQLLQDNNSSSSKSDKK